MRARAPRSPWDVACPTCAAPQGVACHPVDEAGVHHITALDASVSHPARFHTAGMFCADLCDDCPLFTSEVTYEDAEECG